MSVTGALVNVDGFADCKAAQEGGNVVLSEDLAQACMLIKEFTL